MAAEIQERFGVEPELIRGKDGVFEVTLEEELIFSKKACGRFPEPGEVETEIESRQAV